MDHRLRRVSVALHRHPRRATAGRQGGLERKPGTPPLEAGDYVARYLDDCGGRQRQLALLRAVNVEIHTGDYSVRDYSWLETYCLNRFGSPEALEARLPQPATADQLRALTDDRYLSMIALRVFRAGLKHSVVDARWQAFEEVFFGFDPSKVVFMSPEHIERLMQDKRLIRHLAKLRSVPRNAQMVLDLSREHGSMGALIADWPSDDVVGLWRLLARRGNQLGGLSAPRLLRMVGRDTFVTTGDVLTALTAMGVLDRPTASSLRDLTAVQAAFNRLAAESGRPLSQLSVMLACTVNH